MISISQTQLLFMCSKANPKKVKFVTCMTFDNQWKPRWKPYPNYTLFSSASSLDIKIHSSREKKLNPRTELKKITCICNKIILTIKLMKSETTIVLNTRIVWHLILFHKQFSVALFLRFAPFQWQICFANNSDSMQNNSFNLLVERFEI